MQPSHKLTISKYDAYREQAREITKGALPKRFKQLDLKGVDHIALMAFRTWRDNSNRIVDWD